MYRVYIRHYIQSTYSKEEKNWRNITEGVQCPAAVYQNKAEAQVAGREMAISRKVEQLIHDKNGQIKQRNSYGHDPRDIKG